MKDQTQLEKRIQLMEDQLDKLKREVLKTLYVPTYKEIEKLSIEIEILKWVLK